MPRPATGGQSQPLSLEDAAAGRMRRLRRRLCGGRVEALGLNVAGGIDGGGADGWRPLRLLLVGDGGPAMNGLAEMLPERRCPSGGTNARVGGLAPLAPRTVEPSPWSAGGEAAAPPVEVLQPSPAGSSTLLRRELMACVDVVLLCFTITDLGSLRSARERWWQTEYRAAMASVAALDGGSSDSDVERGVEAPVVEHWPETPVVLVGLDAERRQTPAAEPLVTSADAVDVAQRIGARKYVEVFSGNRFHARSLVAQCATVSREWWAAAAAPVLDRVKGALLRHGLQLPSPEVHVDRRERRFRLAHAEPGVVYTFTVDGSNPRTSPTAIPVPASGILQLAGTGRAVARVVALETHSREQLVGPVAAEASRRSPSPAAHLKLKLVPGSSRAPGSETTFVVGQRLGAEDAKVVCLELTDAPGPAEQPRWSTPKAGPAVLYDAHGGEATFCDRRIRFACVARGFYPSDVVTAAIPSTAAPPAAYVDPAWKRIVVAARGGPGEGEAEERAAAAGLSLREGDGGSAMVVYTVDGSRPSATVTSSDSPAGQKHRVQLAPTTRSCASRAHIPLDEAARPYDPWRSAKDPPAVVRVMATGPDALESEVVTVRVPAVLETPRVVYTPHDHVFRIESFNPGPLRHPSPAVRGARRATSPPPPDGSGTSAPGSVEYHYTLDGTTPTYQSPLYTGPVMLPREWLAATPGPATARAESYPGTGSVTVLAAADVREIRVAAFPKLFFPSREAVVTVACGSRADRGVGPQCLRQSAQDRLVGRAIPVNTATLLRSDSAAGSRKRLESVVVLTAEPQELGIASRTDVAASRRKNVNVLLSSPGQSADRPRELCVGGGLAPRSVDTSGPHSPFGEVTPRGHRGPRRTTTAGGEGGLQRKGSPTVRAVGCTASSSPSPSSSRSPPRCDAPPGARRNHSEEPWDTDSSCVGKRSRRSSGGGATGSVWDRLASTARVASHAAAAPATTAAATRHSTQRTRARSSSTASGSSLASAPPERSGSATSSHTDRPQGLPQKGQQQQQHQDNRQKRGTTFRDTQTEPRRSLDPPHESGATAVSQRGREVLFVFPTPIALSHITATTPGDGKGRIGYEVEIRHAKGGSGFIAVGQGDLEDLCGVQTLQMVATARLLPISAVKCVFGLEACGSDGSGDQLKVTDIKIHGKPVESAAY